MSKEVAGEGDIKKFEQQTEELGELMPKYFPALPITPKLYTLGMQSCKNILQKSPSSGHIEIVLK